MKDNDKIFVILQNCLKKIIGSIQAKFLFSDKGLCQLPDTLCEDLIGQWSADTLLKVMQFCTDPADQNQRQNLAIQCSAVLDFAWQRIHTGSFF